MSTGLYSGTSGLALGVGLYAGNPGLWGGSAGLITGDGASLYLNFLAGAPLDSRVTFSRGSNATLVNSTGKITYAPANLLLNSVFGGAVSGTPGTGPTSWTVFLSGGSLTATSLGRSYAANELRFAVTSNRYSMGQSVTIAAGSTYIFSANINVFTSTNLLQMFSFASVPAGATLQYVYGGVNRLDTFIPPTGTGVLQVIITTTSTGGSLGLRVGAGTSSNTTADVSFQDIQFEPVTYQTTPSTYVATTSAAYYGPRFDYDPVTLAAKGLLIEEQRTNLVTYSEQFDNAAWTKTRATISANAAVSPDGTSNADTLVEDTSAGTHWVGRNIAASASTAYTASIFVKAAGRTAGQFQIFGNSGGSTVSFNLSTGTSTAAGAYGGWASASTTITNFGNGWYRITNTATTNAGLTSFDYRLFLENPAGTPTYTGDGTSGMLLYGAQLEAGAFTTSYIPTVASQVTRSADVATMTGTNFSSWYNQSEGTFVISGDRFTTTNFSAFVSANDSSTANEIYITQTTSAAQAYIRSSAGAAGDMIGPTWNVNTVGNAALAYQLNNAGLSFNGGAVVSDTTVGIPTVNRLSIGVRGGGLDTLNGHIRQIAYYNTRLPNTQLVSLTS